MRNYRPQNYSRYGNRPRSSAYHFNQNRRGNSNQGGLFSRREQPMNEVNWRDSNDYRRDYFAKNRGFLGVYTCSQCYKPMISKSKIQVDHIIPPSRFARRRVKRNTKYNTSAIARFLNQEFNSISICAPCNQAKSNKMGLYVVRGVVAKLFSGGLKGAVGLTALSFVLAMGAMSLSFRTMRWAWRRAAAH